MLRATVSLDPENGDNPLLSLVEQLPIPTAVFDRQMNYLAVSQPWVEAYGRRHTGLVGKNYYRVHPGIPSEWKRLHQEILLEGGLRHGEDSWVRSDGTRHWVKWSARPWRDSQAVVRGLIISAEDITERKEAEERLRQSATVIDSIQEGIVITDRDAVILEVNPAFTRITEYSADELHGQSMRILHSGRHDRSFYQALWDSLSTTGAWQGEIWNRRKGGEVYLEWLSISAIRDGQGNVSHFVGITTDLSRMQHAQTELERLAHHDALTKLPNRLLLTSRLEHAVERVRRYGNYGAVLFVDLDHFKAVNDRLGHRAGDELLQLATQRLRGRLRESDTLARLGGDEFVAILEEIGNSDAAAVVASDLIHQVGLPFTLSGGEEVQIGASIGIAIFPTDGRLAASLVEQADQALYEAKRQGRGAYRFWSTEMTQ